MIDPRKPAERATPAAAIVMVLACGVIFSSLDTTAKYLVLHGFAAPFVTWVRFAVHVVLVLIFFRSWGNPRLFRVRSLPQQILRGLFLVGSTFFNFLALQTLQLSETVAIFFFAPMVITALAGPLLGEWAGWRRWLAVFVGFLGMLVVVRPGVQAIQIGHAFAIMAMLSYCFYVISTRRMGATETAESLIFYSALTPVVLLAPTVPLYGSMPTDALSCLLLASLGVYGAFGHFLLIKAYKIATTSALAPYPYSQMVWMVGLGFLVFGDVPDFWTVLGSCIIVASGLYIVHRERTLRLANGTSPNSDDAQLAKRL